MNPIAPQIGMLVAGGRHEGADLCRLVGPVGVLRSIFPRQRRVGPLEDSDAIAALEGEEGRSGCPFRVGQSMQHLIFSTKSDHGLESEPRVTLALVDQDKFELSFGHANRWFTDAEEAEVVSGPETYSALVRFLTRLWGETQPAVPIPDCLRPESVVST